MVKLRQDLNITQVSDMSEIHKIRFEYIKDKYDNLSVNNVCSMDTESSNGFVLPGSKIVVGFDQEMYDRGIIKTYDKEKNEIDFDDPDVNYMYMLDKCTPVGLVYVWQFAIEDGFGGIKVFIGRTWEEYKQFKINLSTEMRRQALFGFDMLDEEYENKEALKSKTRIRAKCFVHNLGHDLQFALSVFFDEFATSRRKGGNIFARKKRKPMKASMNLMGVNWEYRDTLIYFQKSLKDLANDTPECPLQKLPDFDYLTIRTPNDVLDEKTEIPYMINDVCILIYCMASERDKYGTLDNLPLTLTGKMRRVMHKDVCATNPDWAYNCAFITKDYTLEQYQTRCKLYQGGYVHGCSTHIGEVGELSCWDFRSSYPSTLTSAYYPTMGYDVCDVSEFGDLEMQDVEFPKVRWFALVRFKDIHSVLTHNYWSSSKCVELEDQCVDNGRVQSASLLTCWLCDYDWYTFKQAYSWDEMEVLELQKGIARPLPKEMIETILKLYRDKTQLKGTDQISKLIESKSLLNSTYGCFCYKQAGDIVTFNADGWNVKELDEGGSEMFYQLMHEVSDTTSFGFLDLGIICSAAARKRIWDFILHFDDRAWYIDTDSIKISDFTDEDQKWIDNYNKWIEKIDNKMAEETGVDPELWNPCDIKGKHKRLGEMASEGTARIKVLGAKRYIAEHNGEFECTIAGLPKWAGKAKIKTFDDFHDGQMWTTKESGKVCCYYNDNQMDGLIWKGRDGKEYISHDKYGVCLKPVTFDLSLSDEFITFLDMLINGKIDKSNPIMNDTPNILLK